MPTLTANSTGSLIIQGSLVGVSPQIVIQTDNASIILSAGGSSFISYNQQPDILGSPEHIFTGGAIILTSPDAFSTHRFKNISGNQLMFEIGVSNYHSIKSDGLNPINILDIVFQDGNNKKVGIGTFGAAVVANKISVAGNASIGDDYKSIIAPVNGLIVQGKTAIGRSTVLGANGLQIVSDVSVDNGVYMMNGYLDGIQIKNSIIGVGAALRTRNLNNGVALDVSPNQAAGAIWLTANAFHVDANDTPRIGFIGFGTDTPNEKIHLNNNKLLITTDGIGVTSGINTGIRIRMTGNVAEYGRDLSVIPGDLLVHHFIGASAGTQPHITLNWKNTGSRKSVGIKAADPVGALEVRDTRNYHNVVIGDFGNTLINNIIGGTGIDGISNKKGAAYLGFNSYVDGNTVIFKNQFGHVDAVSSGSGVIMFMDESGNFHIALRRSSAIAGDGILGSVE